jgi:CHAD domain-containing protein
LESKPSFLSQAGRERADRFFTCLERATRHPGEKEIHDLRVSIRRLLSYLSVAGELPGKKRLSRRAVTRLKEFMSPLGRLRDAQVKIEWLKKVVPEGDEPTYLYSLSVLGDSIAWEGKVRKLLRGVDRKRLSASVDQYRPSPLPRTALRAKALGILGEREREIESLAAGARNEENVEALHRMRLAFKEYRYSVELLAPLFPSVTAETLKRLHAFQTLLGDLHDLDVLLEEAAHFRRRVLEVKTESVLESRIREIRRREFIRLAPLLSSAVDLSKRVFGTEFSTSLSRNNVRKST